MVALECPVCGDSLDVPDDAIEGELFEHQACGAQLELTVNEGKLGLKIAEEVSEDWGE